MDSVTPTASTSTVTSQKNVQAAVSKLGSDVFLRLFVTQLKSQDPTNPVKNENFVAQLAQFTTLEQTRKTNDFLKKLVSQDAQRTQMNLVNLIGRMIVWKGDTVSLGKADQPTLAYTLSKTASRVVIDVLGKNGKVLRSIQSPSPGTVGTHKVQWDGLDNNGKRLPEGIYRFRVKAVNAKQEPVSSVTFARERVSNVVLRTAKPIVVQSGKTLKTQDIIAIQ